MAISQMRADVGVPRPLSLQGVFSLQFKDFFQTFLASVVLPVLTPVAFAAGISPGTYSRADFPENCV